MIDGSRTRLSLVLLGAVLAIALAGLALDGNWPKVLRVATAGAVYAGTLLSLSRSTRSWWPFAVAGVLAGVASGLLRPEPGILTIAVDSGAAVAVATMHCLGLIFSERARRKLTT